MFFNIFGEDILTKLTLLFIYLTENPQHLKMRWLSYQKTTKQLLKASYTLEQSSEYIRLHFVFMKSIHPKIDNSLKLIVEQELTLLNTVKRKNVEYELQF